MKKGDRVEFTAPNGKTIRGIYEGKTEQRAIIKGGKRTYKPPLKLVKKSKAEAPNELISKETLTTIRDSLPKDTFKIDKAYTFFNKGARDYNTYRIGSGEDRLLLKLVSASEKGLVYDNYKYGKVMLKDGKFKLVVSGKPTKYKASWKNFYDIGKSKKNMNVDGDKVIVETK
tara:strand:+ start:1522 stop:2037 length:516 start_codon:yes stop_codon:yes gene_type:complete